jgi:hypothetical protein
MLVQILPGQQGRRAGAEGRAELLHRDLVEVRVVAPELVAVADQQRL